jgi:hypothetical protein
MEVRLQQVINMFRRVRWLGSALGLLERLGRYGV